jgi:hypothetical protein
LLRPLTLLEDEYDAGRTSPADFDHISSPQSWGGGRITFVPELLIEADDRLAAQRALNLVIAAKLLNEGGNTVMC